MGLLPHQWWLVQSSSRLIRRSRKAELTISGYASTHSHSRSPSHPRHPPRHLSDQRRLLCCLSRESHVPKPTQFRNHSQSRHHNSSRGMDRSNLHGWLGLHNRHARQRKASRNFHCSSRHRTLALRWRARRCVLHRRFVEPSSQLRPAAVAHDFLDTQWIYWVGPCLGSVLAVGFYRLIKVLEYEMANAGQDGDHENDPTKNPEHEVAAKFEERQAVVNEIRAIEEAGGFHTLTDDEGDDTRAPDSDPVSSASTSGKKESMEVRIHRVRTPDLEAQ